MFGVIHSSFKKLSYSMARPGSLINGLIIVYTFIINIYYSIVHLNTC